MEKEAGRLAMVEGCFDLADSVHDARHFAAVMDGGEV